MSRSSHSFLGPLCALALLGACGGDDVCDDPSGALGSATAGDTVSIGACRIESDLSVPADVTLEGSTGAVIAGQVTLAPGSQLLGLSVESAGPVGISAVGTGDAITIERVSVTAERGVAIRIEGLGASLSDVTLTGSVTADNVDAVPPMPGSDDYPTHGLVLVDAGTTDALVRLDDVQTSGFARFGALFRNSHVIWRGGEATGNLTVGVMAERGSLGLEGVSLSDNFQGVQPFPAFGGVFTAGIELTTVDAMVRGNQGYGLLHDDASVGHVDLVADDNGDAALWVQSGRGFLLAGDDAALSGNRLAGVVLVGADVAMIQDVSIDTSVLGTRIDGETGMVRVGDGIHAVMDSVADLVVDGVSMTGNERAGMLIDVADGSVDGAVMNVTVDGAGDSLGVIAQGPSGLIASGAWDASVTRLGATVANDAALTDALDIVGLIGPMFVPPPTM